MQLTTREAAALLGIDPRSVVRAINRGRLRAEKRGRDYLIAADEVGRYRRDHSRKVTDKVTGEDWGEISGGGEHDDTAP